MIELTNGYITEFKNLESVISNKIFPIKSQIYSNYLFVVSNLKKSAKISIYPINHKSVLKLVFNGTSIDTQTINMLPKFLVDNIIHTSGIINVKRTLVYEIYISMDQKYKTSFKKDLNKISLLDGIDSVYEKWLPIL